MIRVPFADQGVGPSPGWVGASVPRSPGDGGSPTASGRPGQRLEPGRAVLGCRVVEPDRWYRCGCEGAARDTVVRRLAHEPSRKTLHTSNDLLTDPQPERLIALVANRKHIEVEATRGTYQRMVAGYRTPDRKPGRELMAALIASSTRAPAWLRPRVPKPHQPHRPLPLESGGFRPPRHAAW